MEENNFNSNNQMSTSNNVNQQVQPTKSNNKVLFVVMALIIACLAGYIVYTKFIEKESDKPKDDNTQEQGNNSTGNTTVVTEKVDISVASDMLLNIGYSNKDYYKVNVVSVRDIDMDEKVGLAIQLIEREGSVSEQAVKEKYATIFYDDYSKVNEAYTSGGCETWSYNNGSYILKEGGGCGSGSISNDAMDYIVSANNTGDTIEIVAYIVIFDLYEKHDLRDYTNDKVILQNTSINENLDMPEEFEKFDMSKYEHQFQHYKFTFKLKNGNYTLYSVEPIK